MFIKKRGEIMAGQDNLVPITSRSREEVREIGRKGGKASGKARREKKMLKDQINLLLSLPLKDDKAKKKLKGLGIDTNNIDNQMAMVIAMWQKALKGDVSAFNTLRDTSEGKLTEKVEMTQSVDATVKEIEKYVDGK